VVHRHATIAALFGVAVIGVWLLHRRRRSERTLEPLTVLAILLAAQGLVGSVQYQFHLPADMVWVHVTLATATWVVLLWAAAHLQYGGTIGWLVHPWYRTKVAVAFPDLLTALRHAGLTGLEVHHSEHAAAAS